MNEIDNFLLDEELNDKIFDATYAKIKVHKEVFDDRFTIVYVKDCNEGLLQRDYSVGGYFDIKNKVIYECDYTFGKIFEEQGFIFKKSFSDLQNELQNEIRNFIEVYSFENVEELKEMAIEKYNHSDDYRISGYEKEVRELFITNDNPKIELARFYKESEVTYSKEYHNKNILIDYLNNPNDTIRKYANIIIDGNKEELGLALLVFEDKNKYLKKIKTNPNLEFKEVYINKKIYNSIKNVDAKTLNITIKYNNNELTFKFEHSTLKRSVANDDRHTGTYGVAYDKVSNFIKENTSKDEKSRWKEDFDFSNITSITYGKKELYKQEEYSKNKTKDRSSR